MSNLRKLIKQIITEEAGIFKYKWEVILPDGSSKSGTKTMTNTELMDILASENVRTFKELIVKWNRMGEFQYNLPSSQNRLMWKYTDLT
jgi:hypothetical protein